MRAFLTFSLCLASLSVSAKIEDVIPSPKDVKLHGETIEVSGLKYTLPEQDIRTDYMIDQLEKTFGVQKGATVQFIKTSFPNDEAYSLEVTPSQEIKISANGSKGWLYGAQTLMQMFDQNKDKFIFETATISDAPAFKIRGFMNDVGRNYMDMAKIKEIIDILARYKYNIYHFHATENPAFRIESKKYPQLNLPENMTRNKGKFYTQDEIKDLIQYAKARNIIILPEIDMPGHSDAFRKTFGFKKMNDPAVTKILTDLIEEVASFATVEDMPYIHIGTDEARSYEHVPGEVIAQYIAAVEKTGRRSLSWAPGIKSAGKSKPILQTWTGRVRPPWKDHEFIDSQENYLNHTDPFEAPMTLFFRKNCNFTHATGIGGILCSWPDIAQLDERNHFKQTPILASIVTYSQSIWNNPQKVDRPEFFSNLPTQNDSQLQEFRAFEDKLIKHRDRYFKDQEFQYVKQTHIPWKIVGPIPHGGKTQTVFPVETTLADSYVINGKTYSWHPELYTGATIIFKHYCDYPTHFNGKKFGPHAGKNSTFYALTYIHSDKDQVVPFWVSGHTWASSDRRNGIANIEGKWFHADPQFFVNDSPIPAPKWVKNNTKGEDPYIDENYFYRKSTPVTLKKGWNKILVKSPCNDQTRRWMFTFVPVQTDDTNLGCNVKEFPGLKFSANPPTEELK